MINWVILFFLSFLTALILTFRSMRRYQCLSSNFSAEYGIYLMQKPQNLTNQLINHLHQMMFSKRFLLSFEKLQKGSKIAHVLFGPKLILDPLSPELGLVELEDYTQNINPQNTTIWEMALSQNINGTSLKNLLSSKLGSLSPNEQLWYQIVTQPKGNLTSANIRPSFYCIIRFAITAKNSEKAQNLGLELIQSAKSASLKLLPSSLTSTQKLDFYRSRALPIGKIIHSLITSENIKSIFI